MEIRAEAPGAGPPNYQKLETLGNFSSLVRNWDFRQKIPEMDIGKGWKLLQPNLIRLSYGNCYLFWFHLTNKPIVPHKLANIHILPSLAVPIFKPQSIIL